MYNDYADEDIPDADPEPNPEPSVPPSPSPVPPLDPPAVSPSPCQGPSPARVHVVLTVCVYTSQKNDKFRFFLRSARSSLLQRCKFLIRAVFHIVQRRIHALFSSPTSYSWRAISVFTRRVTHEMDTY